MTNTDHVETMLLALALLMPVFAIMNLLKGLI